MSEQKKQHSSIKRKPVPNTPKPKKIEATRGTTKEAKLTGEIPPWDDDEKPAV